MYNEQENWLNNPIFNFPITQQALEMLPNLTVTTANKLGPQIIQYELQVQ